MWVIICEKKLFRFLEKIVKILQRKSCEKSTHFKWIDRRRNYCSTLVKHIKLHTIYSQQKVKQKAHEHTLISNKRTVEK